MNLQTDFTTPQDDKLILDILHLSRNYENIISSNMIDYEISKHYQKGTNQFDIIKGHCLIYLRFNGITIFTISHF